MEYPSHTDRRQARRLLTTLVAICLPVLAATFFSGSFFRAGTLQPGEVLNAASAHAAHNPAQGAQASGFGVSLTDVGFTTYAATVRPGTAVVWSNNTARIQSINVTGAAVFGSGEMLPGKQFTYVFSAPGTYRYSSAEGRYAGAISVAEAPQAIVDVNIQGYQFQQANITVNAGDTVRWTNLDPDRHTVTADNGAFDSGELNQGGVYQFTFNTPGTYGYYCARHPGMRGTITVNGVSSTNTPGATGTATAQATGTANATGTGTAQATGTAGTTGTPGATGTGTGTPQPGCNPTGNVGITVSESGFNPSSITVAAGTRVTWTNTGSQRHRIRDINHVLFDSDDLYNGQTFSYTFCNGGTFYYEDARSSATGVVYVNGSTGTGTPASTTTGTPGATGTGTAQATGTAGATGTPQSTSTPGGNIVDVQMQSHDVFVPATINIQTGTTVRWTNADGEDHTSTSDTGVWNSGVLHGGGTYLYTFLAPGTYPYTCLIHGVEMRGTVIVSGPAITPTPGTPTATPAVTNTPGSGTVDVNISNFAFVPANVTVAPGTTVRWTNSDSYPHTSTSDTGVWNSGTLNQGQTYSYTFNTPGTYAYHCGIHPGMTGTITVTGGGATGTPGMTHTPGTTGTPNSTGTAGTTRTATAQVSATPGGRTVNANISNYAFEPQTITVNVGDTVRWTNMDNDGHTVTSESSLFNSGVLTQGQTFQYTFSTMGTYTYYCMIHTMMRGTIIVQAAPATATATQAAGQIFSDVHPTDYFYTPVNWLVGRNIISGYSDGTFRPYNNTTRSQVTKMVVLGEGWAVSAPQQPTFSDVPTSNPFYAFVETAVQHGIISGYSDGTFRPFNNVTRGQLAKIIVGARGWALANPPTATFTDVSVGSPFFNFVETAVQHGIISGYSDGTYRPGNNATRGQISKVLYTALTGAR